MFSAAEASQPDKAGIVVLSHRFWMRRLGGDPSVVGSAFVLNGQPLTIVGVAAPTYPGLLRGIVNDFFVPITAEKRFNPQATRMTSRGSRGLMLVGRLRPTASIEQVHAQLAVVAGQLQAEYPEAWTDVQNKRRRVTVLPESALRIPFRMGDSVSTFLAVLLATVGARAARRLCERRRPARRPRCGRGATRWRFGCRWAPGARGWSDSSSPSRARSPCSRVSPAS